MCLDIPSNIGKLHWPVLPGSVNHSTFQDDFGWSKSQKLRWKLLAEKGHLEFWMLLGNQAEYGRLPGGLWTTNRDVQEA
jgi:hypothetical protein